MTAPTNGTRMGSRSKSPFTAASAKLRQLSDIGRNVPSFVEYEQIRRRAASRLLLVIHERQRTYARRGRHHRLYRDRTRFALERT
jgi:hypothetical protein